jgi:hypothetical protein
MAAVTDMSDLKDLEPLSKHLNTASDELTKTLESIQQKLNDLALGVEVWLSSSSHELERVMADDHVFLITELGYGRLGDGWALLIRTARWSQHRDEDPEWVLEAEGDRKPLVRASRKIRVDAVEFIPNLIDALKDEAERVIESVEKAKRIAESLR